MNQEIKNKLNQQENFPLAFMINEDFEIKSDNLNIENIEVKDPEIVSEEIASINQIVEEVCPTHDVSNSETSEDIVIKSFQNDLEKLGFSMEDDLNSVAIALMSQEIAQLQKKNKAAANTLKFALNFIIHDDLRILIEKTLKYVKE